ncbi:MAG: protein kinase [Elusimicrobia bacterium]|nr:protein kinase [Elusimicrobiota bacterium]
MVGPADIKAAVNAGKSGLAAIPQSPQTVAAGQALDQFGGLAAYLLESAAALVSSAEGARQDPKAGQTQAAQAKSGSAPLSQASGGAVASATPLQSGGLNTLEAGSGIPRIPTAEAAGSKPQSSGAISPTPGASGSSIPEGGAPILGSEDPEDAAAKNAREVLLETAKLLDANPNDAKARADRAEALAQLGDYDSAVEEAGKALKLAPDSIKALNARAFAYNKRGHYDLALQDADAVIKLAPDNALGHLNRAMALEGLGNPAEALQEYVLAAQLDPSLKTFLADAQARREAPAGSGKAGAGRAEVWALGALLAAGLPLGLWARRRSKAARAAKTARVDVGTVIGSNYRIERLIGEGGMGKVFEGFDTAIRRKVAIKMMRAELRREIGDEQILEEARLVALVRHPNVVEIYAALQEAGEIFLVFDFVAGLPLYDLLLSKRRLSLPEAAHILGQVAAGLDVAHAKQVIHRDLKPANVVISNEGVAKLMDFGIAHRSSNGGSQETLDKTLGTMPYMAPEQHDGTVSKESDLYALGVMAYELLTGRRPFEGPEQLRHKREGRFMPASAVAPDLPPSIDAALARALSPRPEDRFHSGSELVAALLG